MTSFFRYIKYYTHYTNILNIKAFSFSFFLLVCQFSLWTDFLRKQVFILMPQDNLFFSWVLSSALLLSFPSLSLLSFSLLPDSCFLSPKDLLQWSGKVVWQTPQGPWIVSGLREENFGLYWIKSSHQFQLWLLFTGFNFQTPATMSVLSFEKFPPDAYAAWFQNMSDVLHTS